MILYFELFSFKKIIVFIIVCICETPDVVNSGPCKVFTEETWRVCNFIIAQMVRGQVDTEEQIKSKDCRPVQPRWENHMLFV